MSENKFERVYPTNTHLIAMLDAARIKESIKENFEQYRKENSRIMIMQDEFPVTQSFESGNLFIKIPFWKRINVEEKIIIETPGEHAKLFRGGLATAIEETLPDNGYQDISNNIAKRLSEFITSKTLGWAARNTPNVVKEDEWFDLFSVQQKSVFMCHSAIFAKNLAKLMPLVNDSKRIFVSDMVTVNTLKSKAAPQYESYIIEGQPIACYYNLDELDVTVEKTANRRNEPVVLVSCTLVFGSHLFGFDAKSNTVVAEDPKNIKFWKVIHE